MGGSCSPKAPPLATPLIPAYLARIEKFFLIQNIEEDIQANLMMNLTERARSRLDAVSADCLKEYSEFKSHLLK